MFLIDRDMAFDFSLAERVRQERATRLLAEEEARNAEQESQGADPTSQGLRAYSMTPTLGANYDFLPERKLFEGIMVALASAGVEQLAAPRIETREANITYTIHARSGHDLLEFMLSSYAQRVLVRSSRNKGGLLGARVQVEGDKFPSVTGESYIVGLNLEAYIMQEAETGVLHLHNQDQLLSNLNEFILNKYELHATSLVKVHNAGSSSQGGGMLAGLWSSLTPSQRLIAPAVVVAAAAVGTLAVVRVISRKR